ncbi:hypothetical protein GOV13_00120 [Candidatus Pacearchaeota archaeon]|nr:hypothetical protein [Candidatus Pacearchaeota archaeon]
MYFDKLNLYICKRLRGMDEKSYLISSMISGIVQFYFEELLKKDLVPSTGNHEKVINIAPFEDLPEGLRKEHDGKSIEVLTNGSEIFLFFDKDIFFEEFVTDPTSLACFFEARLLGNIFGPEKFKKIEETLLSIDLRKHFQLGQYASTQNPKNLGNLNFPDNLDDLDTELRLLKELEEKKITSGVYSADKAWPIFMSLYSKLNSIISEELSLLDPGSLSKYIYNEIEKTLGIKENIFNSYRLSKGTSNEKKYSERLISEEMKTSMYGTSSRFLLEKLIAQGSRGNEEIDTEKWQKLSSLVMKIMTISSILEYLRKPLYDFIKIKLEIDLEEKVFFKIIIEDNPIEKHLSKVVEKTDKFERENLEIKDNSIESVYLGFDKIWEAGEGGFRKINDLLEKYFGFRCEDYLLVLNILTNYPAIEEIGGVCESEKEEIITFISNFLDTQEGGNLLKRNKISKIIDFSTISLQEDIPRMLPSEGTMQDNRLMVKPLASVGGKLIFGPGMIKAASENFLNSIIEGRGVYSNMELLPRDLRNSLSDKRSEVSKRLEKDLLNQLKKITPHYEGNIAEFKGGKNDKCFADIKEESPGEIDALSLHLANKKIIIWEAKEISRKFGAREIANIIIDKFLKEEKGYVERVLKKKEFVEKNLMQVLNHYSIEDTTGWKVDYTFLFYSRNLLMSFLDKKTNFTLLSEIEDFVNKN